MRLFAGVIALTLLASSARAEITIVGERTIPANSFATVSVASPSVIWKVVPKPVKTVKVGNSLHFGGVPGTTYTVYADVIDFDKKTFESADAEIVFSGESPVPPGPNPNPPGPNPSPVNALAQAIAAAMSVETPEDKQLLPALASFYRESAAKVDGATTWGSLMTAMGALAAEKGTAGRLPTVQKAIQGELLKSFPTKEASETVMNDASKTVAKATLIRIATAIEAVK